MNARLLDLIAVARRRWRLRRALGGAALLAAVTLVTVVLAAFVLDRARYAPAVVRVAQAAVWIGLGVLAWRAIGRGLRRRVSDAQVALYLEEHEPTLGGRLLAAVRFADAADGPAISRALVDRLVADAVARCDAQPALRRVEQRGIRRAWTALGATGAAAVLAFLAGPAFLSTGAAFLVPLRGEAASPYAVRVTPGDTLIARGADLEIHATLRGFAADRVELLTRRAGAPDWERNAMSVLPPPEGGYGLIVFDVREPVEYLIEAAGVRSRTFTARVADLPWVAQIEVAYTFPAYTGLSPRSQPGGDIATLAGTRARVTLRPTRSATGGVLAVAGGDTVQLAPDTAGTLSGTLTVRAAGEYRVLLPGPDGRLVPASPAYVIEVLDDLPPTVTFTRPGRDADATPIDEVFIEARAEDDFGVRRLDLVYRVNGGAERTVPLHEGAPRAEVVAGHTVLLEELNLSPGDVISYFARAADGRPGAAPQLSDIYFLAIRPFDRAFREAEQSGMGGEGGIDAGELSERQRQIVAATFRVQRDRATRSATELRNDLATLALTQGRLRDEVATLVRRLRTRGVAQSDSAMGLVADALDSAIVAMREAEEQLGRRQPDAALAPEQRALTHLQRAEAVFDRERQVARGGQQGGGRGGSATAEELADLFELELDRMRNQYESIERGRQQNAQEQVDEALERVRELARRQQQEAERRRAQQGAGTGAPGSGQRRLAEETEELARQLERLSREQSQPELDEAARRLREAADRMRRAAADREGGASADAATDRLRQAQRDLERGRSDGLRRDVDQARARAERLAQQQQGVEEDVQRLGGGQDTPEARAERLRRLQERKDLMAGEVGALERDIERLAREAQGTQPDAARRLREAARGLRDGRVEDKIRYSRGQLPARSPEYARAFEEQIGADLDSLAQRLASAAGAVGESREDRIGRALERTRDVANSLEGLAERMQGGQERQQAQQRQQRQGQQGQQGQGGGRRGEPGQQPGGGNAGPGGERDAQQQFQREMRERTRELRQLRDQLRREGVSTETLEQLIGQMGRADNTGPAGTPQGIESLTQIIVPGLREFEFGVRRRLGTAGRDLPNLAGESRVPPRYRAMVEEYYRALAEGRP